jgi:hypothetical protein
MERVYAGRAVDARRTTLDFVIGIYDDAGDRDLKSLPVVRGSAGDAIGCGNYVLRTNASDPAMPARTRAARGRMADRVLEALDGLLRGYVCEG